MQRQYSVPLLLSLGSGVAEPLKPVAQQGGGDAVSEAYILALVHEQRVNTFVNFLRPRMRSAAADYQSRAE